MIKTADAVSQAKRWFTSNNLKLNEEKTQNLVFSTSQKITKGNSAKLLGVIIDDRLNWSSHVEQLSRKLSSSIFVLRNLARSLSRETLRMSYFALFHSHINYGTLLWGNSCYADKIFRLQKRAVRIVAGLGFRDHCKPAFKNLKIMPLPSLYILLCHKKVMSKYTNNKIINLKD